MTSEEPLQPGTRVRLAPNRRGDLLDDVLSGLEATVERVEEDTDGRRHVGVVLAGDQAIELGRMRQIGHRFFFSPDELVVLGAGRAPSVMVAGLGDAFDGDGGFGAAVIEELRRRPRPAGVRLADFGIRVTDLEAALEDGFDALIVVAAARTGRRPGDVSVLDGAVVAQGLGFTGASMPARHHAVVLEPAGGGGAEMSEAARAAVSGAAERVEELLDRLPPQGTDGGDT